MSKLRHQAASFIMMGLLITLFATIWTGFNDAYSPSEGNLDSEGKTVMQKLNELNLIQGINELTAGIENIIAPNNVFDLVGALIQAGLGVIKTIGGIVLLPIEIINVIFDFYPGGFPTILSAFIGAIATVYVFFILLSVYTRGQGEI